MNEKIASVLAKAKEELTKQAEQIRQLQEKADAYDRRMLAEEIVGMKVASGITPAEDYPSEVDALIESDTDLGQLKLAMKHAGPRFVSHNLVETGKENRKTTTEKKATSEAHRQALDELQSVFDELGVETHDEY